jgi:uncharacterized membrane protein
MLNALPVLLAVGAGLVGGVFFAFSTFVMKALSQLPSEQGTAAMQRINVVVMNPLFLGLFVGTALIGGIAAVGAALSWGSLRSSLLFAAGSLYLVGSFGVTAAFNVPRNERLGRLEVESSEAKAYWPVYVREWLFWNHVRTAASAAAAIAATVSLAH